MKRSLFGGAVALAALCFTGTGANAACNIRGQFCGYPSWAANAFSHPWERVPDYVLDDIERMNKRVQRAERPDRPRYSNERPRSRRPSSGS